MHLPFSTSQFLNVFQMYNTAVWPFQVILDLLALSAIYLAVRNYNWSNRIISGILAFFWLWMGVIYHLAYFTTINRGAYLFAFLYIVQGILFLVAGVFSGRLQFRYQNNLYGITGILLLVYALLVYPILGSFLGHSWPTAPTFGLPCPTTIFTFGLLLWTKGKIPLYIYVIPFLWSLIGFSAALTLGIKEDTGLLVAGILGLILLLVKGRKTVPAIAEK